MAKIIAGVILPRGNKNTTLADIRRDFGLQSIDETFGNGKPVVCDGQGRVFSIQIDQEQLPGAQKHVEDKPGYVIGVLSEMQGQFPRVGLPIGAPAPGTRPGH